MKKDSLRISFYHEGKKYEGVGCLLVNNLRSRCQSYYVVLNSREFGTVRGSYKEWAGDQGKSPEIINLIGQCIYEAIEMTLPGP